MINRQTCSFDSLARLRLLKRTRSRVLPRIFFHLGTVFLRAGFHSRREILVGDGAASRRDQTSSQSPPIPPEESNLRPWPCSHYRNFRIHLSSPLGPHPSSPWSPTTSRGSSSPRQNSCYHFPYRAQVRQPPCPSTRSGTDVSP